MLKHTLYRTTNLVNGKIYVGVHSTDNPDDGYLGSGTALKRALKKYGKNSFLKEVIFVFDDRSAAYLKEREIVDDAFVRNLGTYNLTRTATGREQTEETKQAISRKTQGRGRGIKLTLEHRMAISAGNKGKIKSDETRLKLSIAHSGKTHQPMSAETKMKISATTKGTNNPMHKKGGHSEESKKKMSVSARMREQITCPYCRKSGSNNAMKQWHFNNCKLKVKNENV